MPSAAIEEIAASAIREYLADPRHLSCTHLVDGRNGDPFPADTILCGQHPRSGLLCYVCHREHLRRHDPVIEYTCVICRTVTINKAKPDLAVADIPALNLVAPDLTERRLEPATIAVAALYACPTCKA